MKKAIFLALVLTVLAMTAMGYSDVCSNGSVGLTWTKTNTETDFLGWNVYDGTTKVNSTVITTVPTSALPYVISGLTSGDHTFTLTALDTCGNESVHSTASGIVHVDKAPPAAPGTPTAVPVTTVP